MMGAWAGAGGFDDALGSARAGGEVAFASLWRWLNPPLLRWLTVVAPGSAEDVASEVWVSVARGLVSFEGGERDFRAWVFTLARRRALDWIRCGVRQVPVVAMDGIDIADSAAATSALGDGAAALQAALELLQRLTPDQREVVALRVIVGLSVRETAAVVNRTEGAVRVLCHRGLRRLARQLDAEQLVQGATS